MEAKDLKQELLETIGKRPSPTRSERSRRLSVRVGTASVLALGTFLAAGGVHAGSRPPEFIAGATIGTVALAILATWTGLDHGGSSLGRPRRWAGCTAIAVPIALMGWMAVLNVLYPETLVRWPGRIGLRCLGLSLFLAAPMFMVLVAARRPTVTVYPRTGGAALGAVVGAWTAPLIALWCPIANPAHVALGHAGPIVILAIIGLACGGLPTIVTRKRGLDMRLTTGQEGRDSRLSRKYRA